MAIAHDVPATPMVDDPIRIDRPLRLILAALITDPDAAVLLGGSTQRQQRRRIGESAEGT